MPFPLERQGPANCAKQTQFAPAGSDPGGPIVRNEPNLPRVQMDANALQSKG